MLNTQQFNFDAAGPGFDSQARNKRESRILYLGFSYRFGNETAAPRKNQKAEQPDDAGSKGFE